MPGYKHRRNFYQLMLHKLAKTYKIVKSAIIKPYFRKNQRFSKFFHLVT